MPDVAGSVRARHPVTLLCAPGAGDQKALFSRPSPAGFFVSPAKGAPEQQERAGERAKPCPPEWLLARQMLQQQWLPAPAVTVQAGPRLRLPQGQQGQRPPGTRGTASQTRAAAASPCPTLDNTSSPCGSCGPSHTGQPPVLEPACLKWRRRPYFPSREALEGVQERLYGWASRGQQR